MRCEVSMDFLSSFFRIPTRIYFWSEKIHHVNRYLTTARASEEKSLIIATFSPLHFWVFGSSCLIAIFLVFQFFFQPWMFKLFKLHKLLSMIAQISSLLIPQPREKKSISFCLVIFLCVNFIHYIFFLLSLV